MKKLLLILLALSASPIISYAQEKPNGYAIADAKKYTYKSWIIKKGDILTLRDGSTISVDEFKKYPGDIYYLVGKNNKGNIVYYKVDESIEQGIVTIPVGVTINNDTLPKRYGKIYYEHIEQFDHMDKVQLFHSAKVAFVKGFKNSNYVIQLTDEDAGRIMGKGFYEYSYGKWSGEKDMWVNFTCDIEVKDEKVRIRLYDFSFTIHRPTSDNVGIFVFTNQPVKDVDMVELEKGKDKDSKRAVSFFHVNNKIFIKRFIADMTENLANDLSDW